MEIWQTVLTAAASSVVSALVAALLTAARVGRKVDALELTVKQLVEQIKEAESEVAGFVPVGGRVETITQQLGEIRGRMEAHERVDGHTPTLIRLTRVEDALGRVEKDIQQLFNRHRNGRGGNHD